MKQKTLISILILLTFSFLNIGFFPSLIHRLAHHLEEQHHSHKASCLSFAFVELNNDEEALPEFEKVYKAAPCSHRTSLYFSNSNRSFLFSGLNKIKVNVFRTTDFLTIGYLPEPVFKFIEDCSTSRGPPQV